jgi:hypothetical protein
MLLDADTDSLSQVKKIHIAKKEKLIFSSIFHPLREERKALFALSFQITNIHLLTLFIYMSTQIFNSSGSNT